MIYIYINKNDVFVNTCKYTNYVTSYGRHAEALPQERTQSMHRILETSPIRKRKDAIGMVGSWGRDYPLVNLHKTMENCHLWLIYRVKMVISHSYVSLPEGTHFHIFHEGT